jgi:hypothetical protein
MKCSVIGGPETISGGSAEENNLSLVIILGKDFRICVTVIQSIHFVAIQPLWIPHL